MTPATAMQKLETCWDKINEIKDWTKKHESRVTSKAVELTHDQLVSLAYLSLRVDETLRQIDMFHNQIGRLDLNKFGEDI